VYMFFFFFFHAEDGIRVFHVTGVQTCALPILNTGDTWIDGGKIYRGIFDATVTGGSANVSAITLTGGTIGNVIGIKILNTSTNQIINTATTDVALATDSLTFRIGTGNMRSEEHTSELQ